MENDLVTIALSAFNAEKTIERCIDGLINQTHKSVEIFVIDDASTDSTLKVASSITKKDSRVRVIHLKNNIGTYAAKNLVLSKFLRGEFYAHQDADDYSWPERIEKQVSFLKSTPEAAACGTGIDEFFASLNEAPPIPSAFETALGSDGYYHRKNVYPECFPKGSSAKLSLDDLPKLKIAMNGSVLFRSDAVTTLGGFDGRTRIGGDTDLFLRLNLFWTFHNLQETLYSRLFHGASLTASAVTGFQSPQRKAYAQKIQERLAALQAAIKSGEDAEKLLTLAKQDMFVPEVEYDLIGKGL